MSTNRTRNGKSRILVWNIDVGISVRKERKKSQLCYLWSTLELQITQLIFREWLAHVVYLNDPATILAKNTDLIESSNQLGYGFRARCDGISMKTNKAVKIFRARLKKSAAVLQRKFLGVNRELSLSSQVIVVVVICRFGDFGYCNTCFFLYIIMFDKILDWYG